MREEGKMPSKRGREKAQEEDYSVKSPKRIKTNVHEGEEEVLESGVVFLNPTDEQQFLVMALQLLSILNSQFSEEECKGAIDAAEKKLQCQRTDVEALMQIVTTENGEPTAENIAERFIASVFLQQIYWTNKPPPSGALETIVHLGMNLGYQPNAFMHLSNYFAPTTEIPNEPWYLWKDFENYAQAEAEAHPMPAPSKFSHIPISPEKLMATTHFFHFKGERVVFRLMGFLISISPQGKVTIHSLVKFPQIGAELPIPPEALGIHCSITFHSSMSYFDPMREYYAPNASDQQITSTPPVPAELPTTPFPSQPVTQDE